MINATIFLCDSEDAAKDEIEIFVKNEKFKTKKMISAIVRPTKERTTLNCLKFCSKFRLNSSSKMFCEVLSQLGGTLLSKGAVSCYR